MQKTSEKQQLLTVRVATWSALHPWPAIGVWAAIIIACIGLGAVTGTNQIQGKDGWVGEQGRAAAIVDAAGLNAPPMEKVLISARSGAFDRGKADAAAADLTRRMRTLAAVSSVDPPIVASKGNSVLVKITMRGSAKEAGTKLPTLLAQTAGTQLAFPSLQIDETGTVSTSQAPGEQLGKDLARGEVITLPVTLLILLVVFGSLLAAGIPMLLALTSVFASMGLYAAASSIFPDAGGAVANVILMMGMAVGVDYSLFYLKRIREESERADGKISPTAAVQIAAATSGRAVVISGLAIVVTMVGLYLAGDAIYSSIATGTILVVLVSAVSSLTVLPALLAKLGIRLTRPSRFLRLRARSHHRADGGFWPALLRPALRRPVTTLAVAVAAMLLLSLPLGAFRLGESGPDTYPRSLPAIANYLKITAAFPAEGYTYVVAVRTDAANASKVVAGLKTMAEDADHDPLFAPRNAMTVRTSTDRTVSTVELSAPYGPNDPRAARTLKLLRNQLVPRVVSGIDRAQYGVTGEIARSVDYVQHQEQQTPWVVGFALLATFAMMVAAFRSVAIAFAGVVLNMLSYTATLGVLVLVFQHHWAEGILGFQSVGFISDRVPLILFVILFGLSMDYQGLRRQPNPRSRAPRHPHQAGHLRRRDHVSRRRHHRRCHHDLRLRQLPFRRPDRNEGNRVRPRPVGHPRRLHRPHHDPPRHHDPPQQPHLVAQSPSPPDLWARA
nr:MMPL family transporter [Fodinicola feengrottensis]